ncbi:MAG: hypothetical protein M3Q56_06300, partial [Bacteroidota bacterium]|nr:hypothetical protein [Bacteroidota bacterium]
MKKIILFLSCIAFSYSVYAQPVSGNTPEALVKSGDEQIELGQYYNALEQYEKAYKERKEKDIAIRIARAHFLLRDYAKSINWYNRVLSRDKANKYQEDRFVFGKALKMNANYTEAAAEFQNYITNGSDPDLKTKSALELKGIEMLGSTNENVAIVIKNAGPNINNPESQASPAMGPDGNLYYGSLEVSKDDKDGVHYSQLKSATFTKDKGYAKGSELPETINRKGYHTSNVSFSKEGKTMFYTRVVSEGGNMSESKIYASTETASGWSPALEIVGVNGEFLARHPVEGELFGNKVLIFSSNIPGGKGGYDLYYANKLGEGEYGTPLNIGSVNTEGDEITPHYLEGKLYFSSDGYPSL